MSSLLGCPGEVLNSILEFVSPADLRALARVNKRLHETTEPLLYYKVEWSWSETRSAPVALLLRSIFRRPELAAHIRRVELRGDTFYTEGGPYALQRARKQVEPPLPPRPLDQAEQADAMDCLRRTRVPFIAEWEQAVRQGAMDGLIVLLISKLHNLEHLVIEPNYAREARLLGMLFQHALCGGVDYGLPKFYHLRYLDVKFRHENMECLCIEKKTDCIQPVSYLPYFYLPAIQHLAVPVINPSTLSWPGKTPPSPSCLTSLDLTFIREERLGQILSVTTGLKSLRWTWYYCETYPWCEFFGRPMIDCDQIVAALSHVRDTLTDLTIVAVSSWMTTLNEEPPVEIHGSLRGLRNFDVLQRFQAPLPLLMGFSPQVWDKPKSLGEVLPRNIRCLTITEDLAGQDEYDWNDAKELHYIYREWLPGSKSLTPHLREMVLPREDPEIEWLPPKKEELKELCDSAGIEVKVVHID